MFCTCLFTVDASMKLYIYFCFMLWRSTKDKFKFTPSMQEDSKYQILLILLLTSVDYKDEFLHLLCLFLTECKLENILACIQQFLMNSYQISRNTLHYWWTKLQTSLNVFPMRHSYKSPVKILLYRKNCFIRNKAHFILTFFL